MNLELKFILIDVLKVYVLNIDEIKLNTKIFLLFHKSGVSYPQTCLLHYYYISLKSESTFNNTVNSYSLKVVKSLSGEQPHYQFTISQQSRDMNSWKILLNNL